MVGQFYGLTLTRSFVSVIGDEAMRGEEGLVSKIVYVVFNGEFPEVEACRRKYMS